MRTSPIVRILFAMALFVLVLQMAVGQAIHKRPMQHNSLARPALILGSPLPAGTYTVGAGGNFPTLDSAFTTLSGGGILGPVTLLLTDTLYVARAANKGSFTLLGPVSGAGPTSRITIRPANNTAVTIQGNGDASLLFQNASYITLDGISLQGNTRLHVHALYNTVGFQWNDAIRLRGNCDFVNIQNLSAYTDDLMNGDGVLIWGDSLGAADSCLVSGVFVSSGTVGIYVIGGGENYAVRPKGCLIRNNHIGSPSDSLIAWGIEDEGADGTIIENNHVEHLRLLWSAGIDYQLGISSYYSKGAIIRNNIVHDLAPLTNTTQAIIGILTWGYEFERGSNVHIYNNMVYEISNRAAGPSTTEIAGIRAWAQDNEYVDFNTVNLSDIGGIPANGGSAAAWFGDRLTLRDNIFVNTRNDTPYVSAAMRVVLNLQVSDCNDLYVAPFGSANVVNTWPTLHKSLAAWQFLGYDQRSVSMLPVFRAPHLYLDTTSNANTLLSNKGMPIPGITTDIEGQVRDPSHPDIGADEFVRILVAVEGSESGVPAAYALGQNYPNPFNPSTTISYELPIESHVTLRVFDLLGREVATLVNGVQEPGHKSVQWNAGGVASGVYLYRLQAGSYSSTKKLLLLH